MFIMPVCFHPTTILHVDDDAEFLKVLSLGLEEKLPIVGFSNPDEALEYAKNKHNYLPFTDRCLEETSNGVQLKFEAIRNEIYNPSRFKEIIIIVTDYDMPHTSGIELVKTMTFQPEISRYSHIILTGKISSEFQEKLKSVGTQIEYINKDDPRYLDKLLTLIQKRSEAIFQWSSYVPARILSRNTSEKTSFLFDGNFADVFNSYIKDNNICEFYLFDKQGSYLFLDQDANLSWMFIRNNKGMQNSIALAQELNAPKNVINALESKKYILSLYEKSDIKHIKSINWDNYLLPAKVFESGKMFLESFPDLLQEKNESPKYYYACTKNFPGIDIDRNKILSYRQFLEANE